MYVTNWIPVSVIMQQLSSNTFRSTGDSCELVIPKFSRELE